jgi:Tol biopolymer transport system component
MFAISIAFIVPILRAEAPTNALSSLPTGKLAFVTSQNFGTAGKIYFIAGNHRTTTLAYETRALEFLPDGEHIVYAANDAQTNGVFLYDLKHHRNTALLTNVPGAEGISWSPDGSKVAFERWPADRKSSQIWTANVDGSGAKPLTAGDYFNWTPRWSPDGTKLVFETTRNENAVTHRPGGYRDIYVMDRDGQNQINLTTNTFGHHPIWSPDGKFIAYMARGIMVMQADGSDKRNVSQGKTRDSEPAWSPDGQWIAFTRTAKAAAGRAAMDIWIMKRDGADQRPVTFNQDGQTAYSPSWSK